MSANAPAEDTSSIITPNVPLESLRRETPDLPLPLTPLIGRAGHLDDACTLFSADSVRLLTVTGPAGVGKTRFALAVAQRLKAGFADGAAFVPLAASSSADMILPAIARAVGVRDEGDRPLRERLFAFLRKRHVLLVVDNFEHVIDSAPLVSELLSACQNLRILVTSSTALRVRGEHEFPLAPLAVPDRDDAGDLDRLSETGAVQLFVQRAAAVRPDFALTDSNAAVIAEICARLDGLPLAIELAAARSKVLSPAELLARLDRRFQVLVSQARDVPERQQTMRNAIEWGYNLLEPDEQQLLCCLSVFADGWTLPAAEAVCRNDSIDVLEGLSSLSDRSLVWQREQPDGELRFFMLETIRDYGRERLADIGGAESLREAHARYFEELAGLAETELMGADAGAWLDRLEREHNNLRLALEWVIQQQAGERGLALGAGLWRFWSNRAYVSEGRRWLTAILALPGAERRCSERCRALFGLGRFLYQQGEYDPARAVFDEAHEVAAEIGDESWVAGALMQLGHVALLQGDFDTARQHYDAGLALRRAHADAWGTAMALQIRGRLSELNGDFHAARGMYEESLVTFRDVRYELGEARGYCYLANIAVHEGQVDESLPLYERGLATMRALGDRDGIAVSLLNMGLALRLLGDFRRAQAALAEAIVIVHDLGTPQWIAGCLEVFSQIAHDLEQHSTAVRIAAAASELRLMRKTPIPPAHRGRNGRMRSDLRQQMGNEAYVLAWEQGRLLPLDEAVAVVVAGLPDLSGKSPARGASLDDAGLTPREVEILCLVADGLSNQEIAARLFISPRTTTTHISNILRKLGVSSRTAAVAAARRQRLIA